MEFYHIQNNDNDNKKGKSYLTTLAVVLVSVIFVAFLFYIFVLPDDESKNNNTENNKVEIQRFTHNINEKFNFDGLQYQITSYYFTDWYLNYEPSNNNNVFCIVNLNLFNSTNTTKSLVYNGWFSSSNLYTYKLYCDNSSYSTSYGYESEFLVNHEDIKSSETIECVLMFEIPKTVANNSQEIKLEMTFNKIDDQNEFHIVKLKTTE